MVRLSSIIVVTILFWTFIQLTEVPSTANYLVLGTDYTSYAVVWSCSRYWFFNTREFLPNVENDHKKLVNFLKIEAEFMWILTRDREPSDDVIDSALAVIAANGLNPRRLRDTDHDGCTN